MRVRSLVDEKRTRNRTRKYPHCHRAPWRTASERIDRKFLILLINGKQRTTAEHVVGAPGRTRTSTMFPPPDFESGIVYCNLLILQDIFSSLLCMCKKLCKFRL